MSTSSFVVVPDNSDARAAVDAMTRADPAMPIAYTHASGRPWVLGRPRPNTGRVLFAEAGTTRLLLVGWFSATAAELGAIAARVFDARDLNAATAALHGSFHLIASVAGEVRVQGSLSGVRRVVHARVGGVDVAADRAGVLARAVGAGIDEAELAARLLPMVPAVLSTPMWRGVSALPTDSFLLLDREGRARHVRWWSPPEPSGSLRDGATRLHEALEGAVAARVVPGETVASDLSGGLDSTPLCFLASRATDSLITLRLAVADKTHDDHTWAGQAQEALRGVTHRVIDPASLPAMFDGIATPIAGLDEPLPWLRTSARLHHVAAVLAQAGASTHLTGHGGDEIVAVKPNYLHALITSRPALARRHLAGIRAMRRWPLLETVRALADRSSYSSWLVSESRRLSEPFPLAGSPMLGWEYPLRLPPWAGPAAVELVASSIRERAAGREPYAPQRWAHLALDMVRMTGAAVRKAQELTDQAGAALQAPFLDDRVVEACLSVAVEERASPLTYKPLMVAAMRDHMPAKLLTRTTKGEFSDDHFRGLARHRDQIKALVEDSALAETGLIDPAVLRRAALDGYPPGLPWGSLDAALAAENWLRAVPNGGTARKETHDVRTA